MSSSGLAFRLTEHCTVGPGEQKGAVQPSDAHQHPAAPQTVTEEGEEEDYDPYMPLDPHVKGSLPIKPFKKGGKPYRRERHKQFGQQGDFKGLTGYCAHAADVLLCKVSTVTTFAAVSSADLAHLLACLPER